jgi:hypothetical protein
MWFAIKSKTSYYYYNDETQETTWSPPYTDNMDINNSNNTNINNNNNTNIPTEISSFNVDSLINLNNILQSQETEYGKQIY